MSEYPLAGLTVLDATRMLPGAVLARMLGDLGARVIKIEDPAGGDPFRSAPPQVDGIGAGFAAFYRGAESVCLDLREHDGGAALRKLAKHADVFVESFRPGTLERWDLGRARLRALNPALVTCSLSGYGSRGDWAARVGHDLNFTAQSGLLAQIEPGGDRLPGIQIADVSAGMLACSAILAALLGRARTGIGADLDQPLALGPLPFLSWAYADAAAGGESLRERHLSGEIPAYRVYACSDGLRVALGALEPKFWVDLVTALGAPELAGDGLDPDESGVGAASKLEAMFAGQPRDHWLGLALDRNLPLTAVNDVAAARRDPYYGSLPLAYFPGWSATAGRPAPRCGADTARVLAEFGLPASVQSW